MGYIPFTHSFSYNSQVLSNVIADLPGVGYFKAEPNLPEQVRQVFLKYPTLYPSEPWIKEINLITGSNWMKKQNLDSLSPPDLRREIEDIFLNESSWWTKDESLNGLGAQMIIVCCHLDSTAGREPMGQYNRRIDPAPGADDNGSGLAAVLAIAKYLSQFRGKLSHTIRFCFFNAEEVGLKGSRAYAPIMKDKDTSIKAVVNLDMIGYNNDKHKTFEIHAGYYDPDIRDLCLPIAEVIKQWSDNQGKLGTAQIYKGTIVGGNHDFDRNIYDGAIERSDHFPFQERGYPACHISEDFFANYPTESSSDPRQMTYGNGGGGFIKPGTLTDLIVVAHELTHGVTQYESNLAYSGQPGGLNESMSDVFAIMCDQWVNKQTVNDSHWLIGKDIMVRGGALRSMKSPGGAHPGDRQVSHVRDYREGMGPHQCSGIPNKAFYTACMKVGGNSYETIGKIWYIALKDRLSRLSQFQDAANHTYTIAAELFGEDSNEQKAVASGWSEVGVEARKPTVEEIIVERKKLLSKIDSRLGR